MGAPNKIVVAGALPLRIFWPFDDAMTVPVHGPTNPSIAVCWQNLLLPNQASLTSQHR